jgi:hypothetical protein
MWLAVRQAACLALLPPLAPTVASVTLTKVLVSGALTGRDPQSAASHLLSSASGVLANLDGTPFVKSASARPSVLQRQISVRDFH